TLSMTEKLLQFIWQFQYFNLNELKLQSGEDLRIIFPGQFNSNQGPDFSEARIYIDKTLWAGNIELHINSSDWNKHSHDTDKNYDNVILHVVWEDDKSNATKNIPVLVLNNRVSKLLLNKYEELMNNKFFIPCEKNIQSVTEIIWISWKERLLVERLQKKNKVIENYLSQNTYHWEETLWWLIAKNFGIKINAEAFEAIAKTVSTNILAKHKNNIHQLEALLLGQAGLLENEFAEDYPIMLRKEYYFLKKKYKLSPINQPVHFLRMRPGNFPTVRLAQLAMLIHQSLHLFSKIIEIKNVDEIKKLLSVTANDYWHYHYRFDETSAFKKKNLGLQMVNNIIINTIIPIVFAYGNFKNEPAYKTKALQWLEQLSPEKNSIIAGWENINIENKNAFDSQSLLELKNNYCDKKRCLECAVGNALLKKSL
ncbi:MAG TPA: DUF2851 family protein, partial [Puia sp.]|nr:DUF2851 family protein [Puia sp.]